MPHFLDGIPATTMNVRKYTEAVHAILNAQANRSIRQERTRSIVWLGSAALLIVLLSWTITRLALQPMSVFPTPTPTTNEATGGELVDATQTPFVGMQELTPQTPDSTQTQPTPSSTPEILPGIQPVAAGAYYIPVGWSPDSAWFAFWLSTQEDMEAEWFHQPPASLHFLEAASRQICRAPEQLPRQSATVLWQPENRISVVSPDEAWIGEPCGDFEPIPAEVINQAAFSPDASISADRRYLARTTETNREDGVIYLNTVIEEITTAQVIITLDWDVEERLGDLGLGGNWLTEDIFLIYDTFSRGPLLIQPGKEVIEIAPQFFNVDHRLEDNAANFAYAWAWGIEGQAAGSYHLLLGYSGAEHLFPDIKLYHSETGEIEELPFNYAWGKGFTDDGNWLLLARTNFTSGFEQRSLWVREVEAIGEQASLFAEGSPTVKWSQDNHSAAIGHEGRFEVRSFPDGVSAGVWDTGKYTIYYLDFSPDGRWLIGAGCLPGAWDSAVYLVLLPESLD